MQRAKISAVHPVLASRDVAASVAFYVTHLGFSLLSQDAPAKPKYAVIRRDAVELHIQWNDPAEWGDGDRPMYRFVVGDIQALFDEYKDKGVFHDHTTLRETPWGTREFAFYDPDRNGLTFYRDIEGG
jgi:catechol 2,3-dioxygenase-like lactoylglutathione lyase family enzyme